MAADCRARWGNPPRGVRASQSPLGGFDGHLTHGAAAGEVRLSFVEPVTAADENAGAEGRVQLVARERYVVDAAFLQVDATVGEPTEQRRRGYVRRNGERCQPNVQSAGSHRSRWRPR